MSLASASIPIASPKLLKASSIYSFLQHIHTNLSISQQRAVGAIVGAAVADAATRPFHWVYSKEKLFSTIDNNPSPEFWPINVSPFYDIPTGCRSCYNDLGFSMLLALTKMIQQQPATTPFEYRRDIFINTMVDFFKEPSPYYLALKLRTETYDPSKKLEERVPIPGPWQQGAVTVFLEDIQVRKIEPTGNPTVKETDGLCTTIPLIAKLAISQSPLLQSLTSIANAASALSSSPFAVTHTLASALILHSIISLDRSDITDMDQHLTIDSIQNVIKTHAEGLGSSISTIYPSLEFMTVIDELDTVKQSFLGQEDYVETQEKYGKHCGNPGSFMGATLGVALSSLHHQTTGGNPFIEGVRRNIRGGGCNCSRANFAGACLGAAYGFQSVSQEDILKLKERELFPLSADNTMGIPINWMQRTDHLEEILKMAIFMCTQQEFNP